MNLQQLNLIRLKAREEKLKASVDSRKYNVGYLRKVEEITDSVASDERSGYDTGNYPTKHNFDE